MTTQNADLKFLRSDKVTTSVIKVSTGQNIATHQGILANDYSGYDTGQDYLVAPFDCIVRAIRREDNTVLFENNGVKVKTSNNGVKDHVCFTCTHMNDSDFSDLGISINKTFSKGQVIYREGQKGLANGNHIHMNQACGAFTGNQNTPSYQDGSFVYDGITYVRMKIHASGEASVYDVFYNACPVVDGLSDSAKDYVWISSPGIEPSTPDPDFTLSMTMLLKCTKHTISPNRYPTRPTYNGAYNPNSYFINTGDILQIKDIKVSGSNVVCQIKRTYQSDGSYTDVLNNRWFVYDNGYFE